MSYANHTKDFADYAVQVIPHVETPAPPAPKKVGILGRIFAAIARSRQREADRVIAAYLARSGGLVTDSVERKMMQHLAGTSWGGRG